jgi:CRISPR system Cascade subunit CasC
MSTFIEFHVLRSFPPSNLNRDDLGTPKSASFGGVRRLRISSQCLKRTWRMSDKFRGAFAEEQLGLRTSHLPEEVMKALPDLDAAAREGLLSLLASVGKKSAKAEKSDGADEPDADSAEPASADAEAASEVGARTAHLLFLSRQEIEAATRFARDNGDALTKVFKGAGKKKTVDNEQVKKLRKALKDFLEETTAKNAVDVALFGRFVTSDEFDTVEGALQVAHGLGTQKVEVEYDYFTAVDDLGETTGAGHLGESEFASSVLYLYACCDLGQLERNLGARTSQGRVADDQSRELARRSLPALARAMAEATPIGKKTGTAPHTPAEYIEVVVRRGAPLSYANGFLKPVDARRDGDVMTSSIRSLVEHRAKLETAYGRGRDAEDRFVLDLRDVDGATGGGHGVSSIDELAAGLARSLDRLASTASASGGSGDR